MRARLILFKDGKRLEKVYEDHHDAVPVVRRLRAKGVKANLATCTLSRSRLYPPADDDLQSRLEGMLWCPYCGAWRWFKVPKFKRGAEARSDDWFMNTYHRQGIRVCSWCRIGIMDFWVRRANHLGSEIEGRRRKRKKRVR